jgi:hypothetical protein
MKVAATEFVHFFRFTAIAIHTKTGQFRQSGFSPFSAVQNFAIVRLFFVNQPHDCFLAIVYVAIVPSFGDKAYSIRLINKRRNTLLHALAIVTDSRKSLSSPISINSRLNI